MNKRVLYFNVAGLLLSKQYLASKPDLKRLFEDTQSTLQSDFVNRINLDTVGISLLSSFSTSSGVLLYPLGERYSRQFLINQGFSESVLAPDAEFRMRYNETNSVRRMIAHANAINASWFIASDVVDSNFLIPHFPDRIIEIDTYEGVTRQFLIDLEDKIPLHV